MAGAGYLIDYRDLSVSKKIDQAPGPVLPEPPPHNQAAIVASIISPLLLGTTASLQLTGR